MFDHRQAESRASSAACCDHDWLMAPDTDPVDGLPATTDREPWITFDDEPADEQGLPPAGILAELMRMDPCLPVLGSLLSLDCADLTPDEAITYLQVLQRQVSSLAAVEARALVAAASGHPQTEEILVLADASARARGRAVTTRQERMIRIADVGRDEIAASLNVSAQSAHARITASRLLVGPLARTLATLARGAISSQHAVIVAEAAQRLPGSDAFLSLVVTAAERAELEPVLAAACDRLQDRVLPVALRQPTSQTRTAANRAVLAIDPAGHARRRANARCTRGVWVQHEGDGNSLLTARMATERALACLTIIDVAATDPRLESDGAVDCTASIGERRAEALSRMVLADAHPGAHRGVVADPYPSRSVHAHVDVTIPLDALLGLSDAPGELVAGCARGPRVAVTPDEVRELLSDPAVTSTMRRLVTDPMTGHLLDVGRTRYEIPARLRDHIAARDRTCRFPGCNRRATGCQIDHAVAWDDGGETTRANLGALCVRHHQMKTHAGWTIGAAADDGSCTWLSPLGRRYEHEAQPVLDRPNPKPREVAHGLGSEHIALDPDPPPF